MSRHRQINFNQPIPEDFLDALQEFLSTMASPNLTVTVVNPTTLRIPASADNGQVTIGINGKWRFNSANADAAAPGGLSIGDNPIFVAASDNSFTSVPGGNELDNTDYSFRLIVKPVGQTPTGSGTQALYRQIGVVTWDGAAFTDVRLTIGGGLPKHASTHNPGGPDSINWSLVAQTLGPFGTLAGRSSPVAGNQGYRYFATDANGGTLYANLTGSAWAQVAPALVHGALHLPGGADAIDWHGTVFARGTLAARATYGAAYAGLLYYATDVNGGSIFRGSVTLAGWEQITPGMTHAARHAPGGADRVSVVQVVTAIGSAVAYDGAIARVRAGTTPFDFTTLMYDAAYGKWVETTEWMAASATVSAVGNKFDGSHFFSYKARYDAGLRLQVRVIGNLSRNVPGGIPALAAGVQGPSATDNTHLSGNVQPSTTATAGVLDSTWVDLNASVDNTQTLVELFLRGSGDFSGSAVFVGSIMARWVA